MKDKKIIIVGGGLAGLTLSLFLKKAGIDSEVYEAYPKLTNAGAAFTIAPNGMNVLNELGLADELIENGNIISAFTFMNEKGKQIASMKTGPVEKYGQPSVMILRHVLHNRLYQEAIEQGIPVHYGKRLLAVAEHTDGIFAYFEDGTKVVADLLVGADGIHSMTRRILFPEAPKPVYIGFYGTGGLVDKADMSHENIAQHDLNLVYGTGGFFGYGFNKQDELLWWSSIEVPETEVKSYIKTVSQEGIRADLTGNFKNYHSPVGELIAKTKSFTQTASYEIEPLPRWYKGRVLLIGDAAHAISTTSGQGASMAFEDAMYLAKLLKDMGVNDYASVYARFEAERMPRLAKLFKLARRGNSDKKITNPFKAWIRDKMMGFFIRLFGEKGLEWQYSYKINWGEEKDRIKEAA